MTCRVSANLITLNEERNIAGCLESLRWADEIVVIDGGSSDRTVEIARRFTNCVSVVAFDDYASQRNRAIERSSGDWIFSLDADERVPPRLAREVRDATRDARCRGFWVPIHSHIFGRRFRYSGTQGERKMRLFRRDAGRWRGVVHEIVVLDGAIGSLRHAIEHASTPDLESYFRKLVRYSSLEADRLVAAGWTPSLWRASLASAWTFAKLYFAKLGMLDGPEGLRFCALSAWGTWVAHHKLRERHRANRGAESFDKEVADERALVVA